MEPSVDAPEDYCTSPRSVRLILWWRGERYCTAVCPSTLQIQTTTSLLLLLKPSIAGGLNSSDTPRVNSMILVVSDWTPSTKVATLAPNWEAFRKIDQGEDLMSIDYEM